MYGTAKDTFTEDELSGVITLLPQLNWDAFVFIIEEQILLLENSINEQMSMNHGSISHVAGGIHFLRGFLEKLYSYRELKQ
jgi:hypothetical protein